MKKNKKEFKAKIKKLLNKKTKTYILIIVVVFLLLTVITIKYWPEKGPETFKLPKQKKEASLKIIDENSKTRNYAYMIDNAPGARPQTGLSKAHIVYEVIVEGGITRFLAVYKDQSLDKIGPLRSARHYFIDYAFDNDAVFVHFGWSPKAISDIRNLKVDNINGNDIGGKYFWRESGYSAPHNAFSSTTLTKEYGSKYRNTSEETFLNYSIKPIKKEGFEIANNLKIYYSDYYVTYQYDSENKVYKRFIKNTEHMDKLTNEQITTKNIIVQKVKNYALPYDGEGKGRQELDTVGTGDGFYITEGGYLNIKWTKESRTSKTKYTTLENKELIVNDGNTFIQVQPIHQKTTFE